MGELLASHAALTGAEADWLHRVVGEWQLLADLSFADLLLWLPVAGGRPARFVAVAQMRPTTGPTAYQDDRVGLLVSAAQRPQLATAVRRGRICREGDPVWGSGAPVREEAIPVRHGDRVVAVIGRDANLAATRAPSRLELAYLQTADELAQMVADGTFPHPGEPVGYDGGPRVGDGLIKLDADGKVQFASPNALSAYRRLGLTGDLFGVDLARTTARLAGLPGTGTGEPVASVASGRAPRTGDIESGGTVVQLRALPLRAAGRHIGAVVLVHDVTELRRRDRQLMSKDATIREIHHRVKNNLQTVAALLRLQARRLTAPEARAALEESVRRVGSIAVVHETLSLTLDEEVAFDTVADRVLELVAELVGTDTAVPVRRLGSFGVLPAEVATPLALILTELVQNAVEHAYPHGGGPVRVTAQRADGRLRVVVDDDGTGLPAGFAGTGSGLGLQIVRTLVRDELGGRIQLRTGPAGGTRVQIDLPAPKPAKPKPAVGKPVGGRGG